MRKVKVYRNNELAGELIQESLKSYVFRYADSYYIIQMNLCRPLA